MYDVQSTRVGTIPSKKNGNWEIVLSGPGKTKPKFQFGRHISSSFITTEITSPLGQKSIQYNTIPQSLSEEMLIVLNFEEIDQTNISSITIKGSENFLQEWKVTLKDNRNNRELKVRTDSKFPVTPIIEQNKLMGIGFINSLKKDSKSYFELRLTRKA